MTNYMTNFEAPETSTDAGGATCCTDPAVEATRRLLAPFLPGLVNVQTYANDLKRLTLEVASGQFDPEEIYNRLLDIQEKACSDMEADLDRIVQGLLSHKDKLPSMERHWSVDQWTSRAYARRRARAKEARLDAERQAMGTDL